MKHNASVEDQPLRLNEEDVICGKEQNMKEKIVDLYCSRDLFQLNLLATHLTNAEIEHYIFGDTAMSVLGIENPTQVACIRVFQTDFVRAKAIIDKFMTE